MGLITVAFNPLLVRASVGGSPVFDPADDENALSVQYNDDRVTITKGMYGDVGHVINTCRDGVFNITLKAKSPTNTLLSAYERSNLQFPVKLVNKNTAVESAFCAACMVKTVPSGGGGTSAADRLWVISATSLILILDGHLPAPVVS